jgi:hypothetical protein
MTILTLTLRSCCIDKKSSAELSEAINSMYRWYQQSAVCYVFLADVSSDKPEIKVQFKSSRWFTRGWTLQELIAPQNVVFYSKEWRILGTKSDDEMTIFLSLITRIDEEYVNGKDINLASISKRMSWASSRRTTRTEDIAYCLLGIFDLNMPLLYGEGKRAFRRLQEEILKTQPYEHTLFAWGTIVGEGAVTDFPTFLGEDAIKDGGQEVWCMSEAEEPLLGLFAESPADFRHTGHLVSSPVAHNFYSSPHSSLAIPVSMNN